MPLYRLTYFSENHIDYGKSEARIQIDTLLQVARYNNKSANITGALILDNLWFVQTIEGARKQVWDLFQKIWSDNRHHGVVIVEAGDVESRLFDQWSMAFAARNTATAPILDFYSPRGRLEPTTMMAVDVLKLLKEVASAAVDPLESDA